MTIQHSSRPLVEVATRDGFALYTDLQSNQREEAAP